MSKPELNHVGIIVADLDQAVAFFSQVFETSPFWVKEMPAVGLRLAEFELANTCVELLQYTDKEPGFASRVMGQGTGLNHISLNVDDLQAAIDRLTAQGLRLMDGFPRQGAHGQVAFFEPDTAMDVLLEICQPEHEE
ncbi:MAG: VOC family protein [Desulfarculaceae bacterium]|jgi:methylmalonyl-CoA/ethylmalonyl-CoA epimerase